MARQSYAPWIGVEKGDKVIQAAARESAIERYGRPEPMQGDVKQVPRSGQFAVAVVAKGSAYTETDSAQSYVEIIARKVGGVRRIAEEDLGGDVRVQRSLLDVTKVDAARNMAKFQDNASIAVTAAANGTTVPYTSIYRSLRSTNADTEYTADDNYASIEADATGQQLYLAMNDTIGLVEESEWFDAGNMIIMAAPRWKTITRGMLGTDGRPILVDALTEGGTDQLFGYDVAWTQGARTSATATATPTGNPLFVFANRDVLINGKANLSSNIVDGNPGFKVQRGDVGLGFMTDEALMKAAQRRAFGLGMEQGVSILELMPAA
jgi:hypothetical protein